MLVRKTHPQSRVVPIALFLATVLQLTTAQGDSHDFSRMILAVLYVFVHAYTPAVFTFECGSVCKCFTDVYL